MKLLLFLSSIIFFIVVIFLIIRTIKNTSIKKEKKIIHLAFSYFIVMISFTLLYQSCYIHDTNNFKTEDSIEFSRYFKLMEKAEELDLKLLMRDAKREIEKIKANINSSKDNFLSGKEAPKRPSYKMIFRTMELQEELEGITNYLEDLVSGRVGEYEVEEEIKGKGLTKALEEIKKWTESKEFVPINIEYSIIMKKDISMSMEPEEVKIKMAIPRKISILDSIIDNIESRIYEIEKEAKSYRMLVNFFYFSAVTMTTLGYGDILPGTVLMRFLVFIQVIIAICIIVFLMQFILR